MSRKVLVLGEDTRSFLTVIRSLGRLGYQVDVVCYNRHSPALVSKYINRVHYLNYQAYSQQEWLDALLVIVKQEAYDALLPCDERAIFPLDENKHLFPASCHLGIPNASVLEHLFDKDATKQLALEHQIPVAQGHMLKLKSQTHAQLVSQFGSPFVVKPTLSFKSDELAKRQKVAIIADQDSLHEYTRYLDDDDEFLIEEYFTGIGEGISVFAVKGKVQAFFAHTRVNEPRQGGGSSYRQAIAADESMLQACKTLCHATQFDGVGMFEFKKDYHTNKWILVEVNARFWGSLPLAVYAGIDFPGQYAQYLLGQFTPHSTPDGNYRIGALARSLSNDLYDMKAEFDYDRQHTGMSKALLNLLGRMLAVSKIVWADETIDSYDKEDKAPFYLEVKQFYSDTIGTKLRRRPARNIDEQMNCLMRQLYTRPQVTIKFICYGNIMRSPMAAKTLQLLCKEAQLDWQISSSGFHLNENRRSPVECVSGAKKLGIDLHSHQSRWLSQNSIDAQNDILIVFDDKNTNMLSSFYECQHVYNLADFVPTGLGHYRQIEDPYGGGEKAVEYCYLLVVEAVKNIFENFLRVSAK